MNALVLVAVMQSLAGCGSSPTQPDPGAGSVVIEDVGGIVIDTALRPVAGAVVEILDGPQAGTTALSDANGVFVMKATADDNTQFRATKAGYVVATGTPRPYCGACRPRRWVDLSLESQVRVDLAGHYTLTFIADSACTAIPSAFRTRTYAVTIVSVLDSAPYPAGSYFEATAPDVPHWLDANGFGIATAGESILFMLSGEWPILVEEVGPGEYVNFSAQIWFSVGSASVSTVSTSFGGIAEYWGPGVANPVRCASPNHRMILSRR